MPWMRIVPGVFQLFDEFRGDSVNAHRDEIVRRNVLIAEVAEPTFP